MGGEKSENETGRLKKGFQPYFRIGNSSQFTSKKSQYSGEKKRRLLHAYIPN